MHLCCILATQGVIVGPPRIVIRNVLSLSLVYFYLVSCRDICGIMYRSHFVLAKHIRSSTELAHFSAAASSGDVCDWQACVAPKRVFVSKGTTVIKTALGWLFFLFAVGSPPRIGAWLIQRISRGGRKNQSGTLTIVNTTEQVHHPYASLYNLKRPPVPAP